MFNIVVKQKETPVVQGRKLQIEALSLKGIMANAK